MSRNPRVAIVVKTSSGWGRRLIRGITIVDKHEAWDIDVTPRDAFAEQMVPGDWVGDGIIARIRTPKMAERLSRLKVPVINVSGIELPGYDFPRVTTNLQATAKLAADYFAERGYVHLAYVGPLQHLYVAGHATAFRAVAADRNDGCVELFDTSKLNLTAAKDPDVRALDQWVQQIPRSAGLFS